MFSLIAKTQGYSSVFNDLFETLLHKLITGEIRLDELGLSTISNTDSLIHRYGMIVTVKVWARYPNRAGDSYYWEHFAQG